MLNVSEAGQGKQGALAVKPNVERSFQKKKWILEDFIDSEILRVFNLVQVTWSDFNEVTMRLGNPQVVTLELST